MSKIDELIRQHCPNGVEYKTLGSILLRRKGTGITAGKMAELHKEGAPVRVFAAGSTVADLEYGDLPEKSVITEPGIIVKSRGYIGFEYYERPYSHKSEMWSYTANDPNVVLKYVYYHLQTQTEALQFLARSKSVKLPQLATGDTDNLKIPVPPIEVQQEIVRILDAMCELEAKLKEELEVRERQFRVVLERMLNAADSEQKTLGELGSFHRGSSFQKKHFIDAGEPCIHYGQIHTRFNISATNVVSFLDSDFAHKMKRANSGDLIIATTSEDDDAVGKAIAWMGDESIVVSTDAYIYKHSEDPMYMAYVFASESFNSSKMPYITGSKVRRIHEKHLSKISIPVPPIETQREIVAKLDAFEALIQSLRDEIAARHAQYEHYLDQLLTFEEAS